MNDILHCKDTSITAHDCRGHTTRVMLSNACDSAEVHMRIYGEDIYIPVADLAEALHALYPEVSHE